MARIRLQPRRNEVILDPVHYNRGTEAWYREKLLCWILAMHNSIVTHLQATWKRGAPDIGFASDKNPAVSLRRSLKKWGDNWISKFDDMADEISRKFAAKSVGMTDRAIAATFKKAGFTVKFQLSEKAKQAYQSVISEQISLIKSIPSKYLTDVQSSVFQAVMRGGDLGTLSRDLIKNYGVSVRRAALISRDQSAKSKAIIENIRRQEIGLKEAIWMHSSGGKVPRPAHVAMDGKRYKISQGMWDDDEGKYVFPGELINCRCTSRVVIPGFDDDD